MLFFQTWDLFGPVYSTSSTMQNQFIADERMGGGDDD